MSMSRTWAAVAVVAITAATAACSSALGGGGTAAPTAPSTSKALSSDALPGEVCVPVSITPVLIGAGRVIADGTDVTITGVSLVGADGAQISAAWLLPGDGGTVGAVRSPISDDLLDSAGLRSSWQDRRKASGAVLGAADPRAQLVIEVSATAATGQASAVQVSYRTATGDGTLQVPRRLKVAASKC